MSRLLKTSVASVFVILAGPWISVTDAQDSLSDPSLTDSDLNLIPTYAKFPQLAAREDADSQSIDVLAAFTTSNSNGIIPTSATSTEGVDSTTSTDSTTDTFGTTTITITATTTAIATPTSTDSVAATTTTESQGLGSSTSLITEPTPTSIASLIETTGLVSASATLPPTITLSSVLVSSSADAFPTSETTTVLSTSDFAPSSTLYTDSTVPTASNAPEIQSDLGGSYNQRNAIIGGVVGGVGGAILIGVFAFLFFRYKRAQDSKFDLETFDPQPDTYEDDGNTAVWSAGGPSMSQIPKDEVLPPQPPVHDRMV
ncbi:hypothetical protein BDF14DRAFT_1764116 [Spinellus fusiger]|nr:hypothetical protein BDF14DRAFT_1764116 [Spinellus fusiger]